MLASAQTSKICSVNNKPLRCASKKCWVRCVYFVFRCALMRMPELEAIR